MPERESQSNNEFGLDDFFNTEEPGVSYDEDFYVSLAEKEWAEEAFKMLDTELLRVLDKLLAKNIYQRKQFFYSGPECITVMNRLRSLHSDYEYAQELHSGFKTIGARQYPAQGMAGYIEILDSRELRDWFQIHNVTSHISDLAKWNGLQLQTFLTSPLREELMREFNFSELTAFIDVALEPAFILMDPEIRTLFKRDSLSWNEKLEFFARISEHSEAFQAPYDTVRELLWKAYQRVDPSVSDQPEIEQQKQSMQLVHKLTENSTPATIAAQFSLPQINLWNEIQQMPEYASVLRDESNEHLFISFLPTIGYEWEYSGSLWKPSDSVIKMLDKKGIKEGGGGNAGQIKEISPGPFYRPETAQLMAHLIYESGFVDPYFSMGNSIHWNIGLSSFRDVSTYVAWLQATGLAYQPYEAKGELKQYKHRIHSNYADETPYVELKAFNFQGLDEFKKHINVATYLGAALAAYQSIVRQTRFPNDVLEKRNSEEQSLPYINLSGSDINNAPTPDLTKKLAEVWAQSHRTLVEGFRACGVHSFLDPTPEMITARHFAEHMWKVFPQGDSIHDRSDNEVFQNYSCPFEVSGKWYPNLVAFSRSVAYEACTNVEKLFSQAEDKAIRMLEYMGDQQQLGPRTVRQKFFKDFPASGFPGPHELRIIRLQKRYLGAASGNRTRS